MHFISTRGRGARSASFCRCAAGRPGARWRPLSAGSLAAVSARRDRRLPGAPYQDVAFDILSRFAGGSFTRRRAARRHRRRLCRLRRARHRAAGRDRPRAAICWSCFTVPRSPSRTSRCRSWAGCSPARWPSAAAAPPSSRRPRATPARPPSPRWAALPNIDVFVLHPKGRVSEVQRRQMTTSAACQCPQHRAGRHLRRRAGHREGAVRRHRIRRAGRPDRRQLDQLRAHRGADASITSPPRRSWAGPRPSSCRPEISATSSPARRRCAWALPSSRLVDRHQRQRHHGARAE